MTQRGQVLVVHLPPGGAGLGAQTGVVAAPLCWTFPASTPVFTDMTLLGLCPLLHEPAQS